MAVTKANLPQMLSAIQSLNDALPQVQGIGNRTDDALSSVQASWQSPSAAPAFYQHLQTWQSDHQALTTALNQLLQALSDAHTDLQAKEQSFTS